MKKSNYRRLHAVSVFVVFALCRVALAQECATTDVQCAQASQVGIDVKNALVNANATGLSGLSLQKAVLTLETASTNTGGLNFNFLVFTIKHQVKKSGTVTQQITWGSVPKPEGAASKIEDLRDALARAIGLSAKIASSVSTLPLAEATITIKFVVDKDTGGSISYKIAGIDLGPNIDFDKVSTNTLTVTFSKTGAQ
jgi:hypothetical protein